MARYTGPRCRLCRREGLKLFLKGEKCNTEKCPFSRRPYPPGQHGRTPKPKPSYYALQLREKQKVKEIYGILERQFRRYFEIASRKKGETGRVLLQILERRLDNVVYRLCFASSRIQARQFVRHGFIKVNGRKVDIPSYIVREQDTISVKDDERIRKIIKENIDVLTKERSIPKWLELNSENLEAKILRLPEKEDLTIPVQEQLIVELYSK